MLLSKIVHLDMIAIMIARFYLNSIGYLDLVDFNLEELLNF